MAPTDNNKWAALRELARFSEEAEVADAMRRVGELADQQPGDAAVFVAATEAIVQAEVDKRVGEAHTIVGSRHA
jgi:hypothetical protein